MNFCIFHVATGQILRHGSAPAGMVNLQLRPGEDWIEGQYSGEAYYIAAYQPVAMPPRPSVHHVFDYATKAWVDQRTLADHRAAAWARIKRERDAREFGGFDWGGSRFDSDVNSQRRIHGAVQMALLAAGQPFSIDWTLADNSVRTLSAAQMVEVGAALGARISGLHMTARTLRAAIAAATTVAEVEAVHWPAT